MPPPFTNSSSAISDTAATTAARRSRISRAERRLQRTRSRGPGAACRAAGRRGPRCGPRRPSARRAARRGATRSPAPAPPPGAACGSVSASARSSAARRRSSSRRPAPSRRGWTSRPAADSIRSRCAGAVHHQDGRGVRLLGREPRELGDRRAIGRRVSDDEIVEALLGEPQRLGQRVGEQPAEARRPREDPLEQRPGSGPTCSRPGSACPAARRSMSSRVPPHGVQVDEREGRLDAGERARSARSRPARSGAVLATVVAMAVSLPLAIASDRETLPEQGFRCRPRRAGRDRCYSSALARGGHPPPRAVKSDIADPRRRCRGAGEPRRRPPAARGESPHSA